MVNSPRFVTQFEKPSRGLLKFFGEISYSLYVVHFPWLALLSAWWLSSHARLPLGVELVVPGVISALLLALCCWYLVERHFVSAAPRRSPARAAHVALRY
jgi:peptidoglycan/LPS O-acetylase OafA/YrhL